MFDVATPLNDPSVLTERIRELIDQDRASGSSTRMERIQSGFRQDKIEALMQQVAAEFGRRHEWNLAKTRFPFYALAKKRQLPESFELPRSKIFDHAFFYRERKRPHRAAAIAAHLYDWPECGPEVERVCLELGIRYEAIVYFPSWWYPGCTQIVLYTPYAEAAAEGDRSRRITGPQLRLF